MSRPCVYVLGAYRPHDGNIVTLQDNMRLGLELSVAALRAGYAVFSPWHDFQLTLMAGEPIPSDVMLAHSLAWMKKSDAILVQPVRLDTSSGGQEELAEADIDGIPFVHSLEELQERFPLS